MYRSDVTLQRIKATSISQEEEKILYIISLKNYTFLTWIYTYNQTKYYCMLRKIFHFQIFQSIILHRKLEALPEKLKTPLLERTAIFKHHKSPCAWLLLNIGNRYLVSPLVSSMPNWPGFRKASILDLWTMPLQRSHP